ncbi:MAG: AAA family ATPase [Deltaproteobacteria bacterium]|nr:AAA family ATPase [Deltaproteobacteria bacterium]
MYFKKIHLESFGQFKNKTIEFSKGVNLILGPNEAGKSTLLNCIYGIFFGFTHLKELYLPWGNKNRYCARLDFEIPSSDDKGVYSLERDFLNDEVTFIENGKKFQAKVSPQGRRSERHIYFNKIGKYLGFSDPVIFRKITFIGQGELNRKYTGEESLKMKALLSGLSEHNYDDILKEIEEKYFSITRENPEGTHKRNNRILEEIREKKKKVELELIENQKIYKCIETSQKDLKTYEKKLKDLKSSVHNIEKEQTFLQDLHHILEKEKNLNEKYKEKSLQQKKITELKVRSELIQKQLKLQKYIFALPLISLMLINWWYLALLLFISLSSFVFYKWNEKRRYKTHYIQTQSQLELLPDSKKLDEEISNFNKELFILREKKERIYETLPQFIDFKDSGDVHKKSLENSNQLQKNRVNLEKTAQQFHESQKNLAVSQKGITPPSRLYEEIQVLSDQEKTLSERAQSLFEAKFTLQEAIQDYRESHITRFSKEVYNTRKI